MYAIVFYKILELIRSWNEAMMSTSFPREHENYAVSEMNIRALPYAREQRAIGTNQCGVPDMYSVTSSIITIIESRTKEGRSILF